MSRYWSDVVHGLTPYVPGEQPKIEGLTKLNTNECPYGPSAKVLQASALRASIARHQGLQPELRGLFLRLI